MHVSEVRADLVAEQQALDDVVAALADDQWRLSTPSPRWTIADQIGHLTYFDATAALAITDPDAFTESVTGLLSAVGDETEDGDNVTLGEFRAMQPSELLEAWRRNRATLEAASATLENDTRVVWYGPSMGSKSFLTARLMEAWAHGQDICDAVGAPRPATDRLRHIAQLGFITRGWTYINRGLTAPENSVAVDLVAPSGEHWRFGPEDAAESITGSAEDFCLVVTQRRHVSQTDLVVEGETASEWIHMAQAFAGPATDGPTPV